MPLRRLLLLYVSALALLCLSVVASLIMTELTAQKLAADATSINDSGRQRMLSQRIIYLAQDLTLGINEESATVQTDLQSAIEELEASIALFGTSHATLTSNPDILETARHLYFQPGADGRTLDDMVKEYLFYARGILLDPSDQRNLAGLHEIERAGLLPRLDTVVAAIEQRSLRQVTLMQQIGRTSLLVALGIVLLEIAFIFVPGHRMIQSAIDDLEHRNTELRAAWKESEALRTEQAEFTYAVSHDLKSPSNTIGLILNEIQTEHRADLPAEVGEYLDEARATVDRIGHQIEDILQYAWATGDAEPRVTVSAADCLSEVQANLRGALNATGGKITLHSDASFEGFRRQIVMLLQNLCDNALKYQPKGQRPVVQVSATPLTGEPGIILTVQDNGIGIAPQDQDNVFRLFTRLHLRSDYPGTGLGLATCRRIVENHRGDIRIESALGEGTTFRLTLRPPRARGAVEPMRKAA